MLQRPLSTAHHNRYGCEMDVNVNLAVLEEVFHGRLVEEEDWARLVAEGMRL